MKTPAIGVIAVLLLAAVVNYFFFISNGEVRTVEFLSILAIGMLSGALITALFRKLWKK